MSGLERLGSYLKYRKQGIRVGDSYSRAAEEGAGGAVAPPPPPATGLGGKHIILPSRSLERAPRKNCVENARNNTIPLRSI